MKNKIFENGLEYVLIGDYYYPILKLAQNEIRPIGKYGMLRKTYLSQYKKGWYTAMLFDGTLDTYLADFHEQAEKKYHLLVTQMMKAQGVNEELKARDGWLWVQFMNGIAHSADEIILSEMVYS